jgi:hypothetical protein
VLIPLSLKDPHIDVSLEVGGALKVDVGVVSVDSGKYATVFPSKSLNV